jgi:hypothetical protein
MISEIKHRALNFDARLAVEVHGYADIGSFIE